MILHASHLMLSVSESLVQRAAKVLLGANLLLAMILHASHLMLSVPEFAKERLPFLCFVISNGPGLIQLISKGKLQLGEHVGRVLHLLQLTEKVSVLSGNLPL